MHVLTDEFRVKKLALTTSMGVCHMGCSGSGSNPSAANLLEREFVGRKNCVLISHISMARERLQKILAAAGVASRRASEALIADGAVCVNGVVVRTRGAHADATHDYISVHGKKICAERFAYYAVHKPIGVVSTAHDPHGRPTVVSLVSSRVRVYPVGRLDADSHGLIFLTNDGAFAHRLAHPKFEHRKEYEVSIEKRTGTRGDVHTLLQKLLHGVKLEEGVARADTVVCVRDEKDTARVALTLHQGWKRQIRRMLDQCGWDVHDLCRVRIGQVHMGDLKEGDARQLSAHEVAAFQKNND